MIRRALLVSSSVIALFLSAKISFQPEGSLVPITVQSLIILLISIGFGQKVSFSATAIYLTMGFSGFPVFAKPSPAFSWGPSSGYLLGMLVASWVVGGVADQLVLKGKFTLRRALELSVVGTVFILGFGMFNLFMFSIAINFHFTDQYFVISTLAKLILGAGGGYLIRKMKIVTIRDL
jgi:biotin transporter BioY